MCCRSWLHGFSWVGLPRKSTGMAVDVKGHLQVPLDNILSGVTLLPIANLAMNPTLREALHGFSEFEHRALSAERARPNICFRSIAFRLRSSLARARPMVLQPGLPGRSTHCAS